MNNTPSEQQQQQQHCTSTSGRRGHQGAALYEHTSTPHHHKAVALYEYLLTSTARVAEASTSPGRAGAALLRRERVLTLQRRLRLVVHLLHVGEKLLGNLCEHLLSELRLRARQVVTEAAAQELAERHELKDAHRHYCAVTVTPKRTVQTPDIITLAMHNSYQKNFSLTVGLCTDLHDVSLGISTT